MRWLYSPADGPLAQLVEQGTLNPKVEGSNPSRPTSTCRSFRRLGGPPALLARTTVVRAGAQPPSHRRRRRNAEASCTELESISCFSTS